MKLVEQHVIKRSDPRYPRLDAAAFASKNLWNAANYLVRQSFIFQGIYLNNTAVFHLIKEHAAYQALPRKVSNQVLLQLHQAWIGFFEAMEEWHQHPERFTGRPNLPGYKHKTQGRNLLVYEKGAIWKRQLDQGVVAVTELGALVPTAQNRETVCQVRIVPKGDHYVIEVVYQEEARPASVDPAWFVAVDLGVSVLAALISNKPGFIPRLVNGGPIKSLNQFYNKQCAHHQSKLAKANRFTSRQLRRITTKRNRRILHYLHTASRRIIELLVAEGIGTLIIGKNALWKQEVEMGRRNNQNFVQVPHTRFIELLTYKAQLVGIGVILTEESYTSRASFLDRDEIPVYNPSRAEEPRFSGKRDGRWYYASNKRMIHSDVNGSYNIGRKVVPTAFDGPGIAAPAVRPRRLAV
ncbi:MAG TPA: transposase [Ktedonobacteraceae bacterium]|nr:transposase [Ktedonobacteraceae bacterium]